MRWFFFFLFSSLWANDLLEEAARCRYILKQSLVDYYLPSIVDPSGGYLENWKGSKFVAIGEKSLVMQARQLWFFSTLALEGIEVEAALRAAQAGYVFLESKMRDRQYGGYFSKVTDCGAPKDRRKHVYLSAFAIYGLVAYHKASQDSRALTAAQDLFWILEKKAYDRRYGGYLELFTQDWKPITHRTDSPVGPGDIKTHNTHLHVMEALTELYRVWPDPVLRERLNEMLVINTKIIRHPKFSCNLNEWHFDWSFVLDESNLRVHYGHELECSWLALEAVQALGIDLEPYRSVAESLCTYSLQYGYDLIHGGFFYAGPFGKAADDTKKEWWVQAEALVALLKMFQLTGKQEYYTAFKQTLDFVEKYQLAPGGGWWATLTADGSPSSNQRSSGWQGAYHNGRALIICAKILEANEKARSNGPCLKLN